MLACHAGGPGSIPGRCKLFLSWICNEKTKEKGRPHASGKEQKVSGDGGYRSPYLSHAKRALYHLSYVPGVVDSGTELEVNHPKVKVTLGELSVASSVALLPAAVHIPR